MTRKVRISYQFLQCKRLKVPQVNSHFPLSALGRFTVQTGASFRNRIRPFLDSINYLKREGYMPETILSFPEGVKEANIENLNYGAFQLCRSIFYHEICYNKPHAWFKIWTYLIGEANHKDKGQFKRGEHLFNYAQIEKMLCVTRNELDHCIRYLKKSQMLATRKATRGFFVTISNYDFYQTLNNYKSDTKSDLKATRKRHGSDTINKNVRSKELKNISKIKNIFIVPTLIEAEEFFKDKCDNSLFHAKDFFLYYENKSWIAGRTKMKDWHLAAQRWINNIDLYSKGGRNGSNKANGGKGVGANIGSGLFEKDYNEGTF